MIKTSKDLDLSSIITQVSKDDENNRSIPLTTTVATSSTAQTTNGTKNSSRSSRRQRLVSLLLCCLGGSCRHRPSRTTYSPTTDTPVDHEVNKQKR